jgi:chromosome segregation ATPase
MDKSLEDRKYTRMQAVHKKNLGKLLRSGLAMSAKDTSEGDRGFLPSISANHSLNRSTDDLKQTSIADDLQNQIHEHLKMISEVVKKTAAINEQTEGYRTQLQELKSMFDLIKADAEDKIVNFKVQAMSLTSKRNSAQMRINQIKTDIEALRAKIDNWRIDECHFASSLSVDKRRLEVKEMVLKRKAEIIATVDTKVSS